MFPLPLRVSIAPGADLTADPATWTWTDITDYARRRVSISRGRPDETGQTPPASCRLRVNNAGGRFVARNPLGPWYPLLRRNCPLRVEVQVAGVWHVRFTGFIAELPVTFVPGSDDTYVELVASGVTRRLGQGAALRSAQYRAVSRTAPLAYWPLEDGTKSTQAAASAPGVPPLTVTRGNVRFAGTQGPDGSAPLADFSSGGTMSGVVPAASTTTVWRLECSVLFNTFEPGSFGAALAWTTGGTIALWEIDAAEAADGGLSVQYETTGGGFGGPFVSNVKVDDGLWHHIRVDAAQSGGNIALTVRLDGVTVISQTITGQTMGAVQRVTINPTGDVIEQVPSLGHLAVWAPYASSIDTLAAFRGFAGETAPDRMVRLCAEEGVPFVVAGSAGEPMGPQPVATLLAVLREAEATDGGILFERTDGRLGYLRREDRYNRLVELALTYGQLAGTITPTDDDRFVRNDVTASRVNGSWAQATDDVHIAAQGRYNDDVTVNPQADGVLVNHAGWRVHLGTVDELRFPQVTLNLRNARVTEATVAAWLAVDVGSRMAVSDPPPELALTQIDQVIEGYDEVLDRVEWTAALHCSPASGWDVATVDGDQRVAADGSTLAAALTDSDMSLLLSSTVQNGPWTTDPTDFPLDIEVGGERVTASAIGPAVADTFTRTVSSGWGTANSGQVWATSGGSASDHSTTGGRGRQSLGSLVVTREAVLPLGAADVDLTVGRISISAAPTGGNAEIGVRVRVSGGDFVEARVFLNPGGGVTAQLRQFAGGVDTGTGFPTVAGVTTSTALALRVQAIGTALRAKVWASGTAEPDAWTFELTGSLLAAGSLSVRSVLASGVSNTLPLLVEYDDLTVANPQTVTLSARGVNGVQRAWPAGTPVDVWSPAVSAL